MDLVTLALAKSYIDKRISEEGIIAGATPQQAAQIEQNKTDIADLQAEIEGSIRRFYLNITVDPETGEPVAAETFEEVLSAYNEGMDIIAKVTPLEDQAITCVPLEGYYSELGGYHGEFIFSRDSSSYMYASLSAMRIIYTPEYLEVYIDRIGDFKGATGENKGTPGFVPAPNPGDQNKFLRGNGQWTNIEESDIPDSIARKTNIPDKLSDLENDLYYHKELLALQISGSEMSKDGRKYTFNVDGEHYVNDGTFEGILTIDGIPHVVQCNPPMPDVAPPDFFPDGKIPYSSSVSGQFGAIQIADGFLEGGTPDAPAFSCTGTLTVTILIPRVHEEIVLELKQVQTKMVPVEVLPIKKIRGERLLKFATTTVNTDPTTDNMYYFNFDSNLDIEEEFDIELVFANEAVGGTSNPERSYKTYGKNDMCIVRNSSSMIDMCLAGARVSTSSGYDVFSIKVYTGARYVPGSNVINSTERGFVIGLYREYDPNNTATALPVEVRIYTINY